MPSLLTVFTVIHVLISLVAIASGFIVLSSFVRGRKPSVWTSFFLTTTVLTSVTGFGFPVDRLLPAHIFGVISLVALAIAIYAFYKARLIGNWRITYLVSAILSQYLNVFVLIIQSFLKISFLRALAPTQSELPFALAQGITLLVFIAITAISIVRFQPLKELSPS